MIGLNEGRRQRWQSIWHLALGSLALALLLQIPLEYWLPAKILGPVMPEGAVAQGVVAGVARGTTYAMTHGNVQALAQRLGVGLIAAALGATVLALRLRYRRRRAVADAAIALGVALIGAMIAWGFPTLAAALVLMLVAYETGDRLLLGVGLLTAACGLIPSPLNAVVPDLRIRSYCLLAAGVSLLCAWSALWIRSRLSAAQGKHA